MMRTEADPNRGAILGFPPAALVGVAAFGPLERAQNDLDIAAERPSFVACARWTLAHAENAGRAPETIS